MQQLVDSDPPRWRSRAPKGSAPIAIRNIATSSRPLAIRHRVGYRSGSIQGSVVDEVTGSPTMSTPAGGENDKT